MSRLVWRHYLISLYPSWITYHLNPVLLRTVGTLLVVINGTIICWLTTATSTLAIGAIVTMPTAAVITGWFVVGDLSNQDFTCIFCLVSIFVYNIGSLKKIKILEFFWVSCSSARICKRTDFIQAIKEYFGTGILLAELGSSRPQLSMTWSCVPLLDILDLV